MEKVYPVKQTVEFSDGTSTTYNFTENPKAEEIEKIVDEAVAITSDEEPTAESPSEVTASESVSEVGEVSATE